MLLVACGGGGDGTLGTGGTGPGQGGIPAVDLPYAPCAESELVGQFVITLGAGFTSIDGKVTDGVLTTRVPDELSREGDCRLLRAAITTCEPACPVASQVCGREGECVDLPRARDLGTVTVHGLVIPLQMNPNALTRSYTNPAQPMLPHPGFTPGADLRITTGGGDYAPFELRGWGVSALTLDGSAIQIVEGRPTALAWQAPDVAGPARIDVQLNINQHGSTNAWIECEFADTGAGEIPATLIDGLIDQGLSGFPTLSATRRTASSVGLAPGCVELLVTSEVTADVQVEGITSCDVTSECPSGQTCLPVERFCQ